MYHSERKTRKTKLIQVRELYLYSYQNDILYEECKPQRFFTVKTRSQGVSGIETFLYFLVKRFLMFRLVEGGILGVDVVFFLFGVSWLEVQWTKREREKLVTLEIPDFDKGTFRPFNYQCYFGYVTHPGHGSFCPLLTFYDRSLNRR